MSGEFTRRWAMIVWSRRRWPGGEEILESYVLPRSTVKNDSEFDSSSFKKQMCNSVNLFPLSNALLNVEREIRDDARRRMRNNAETKKRINCLYAIADRLANRLSTHPLLLNEMYVHNARDEFVHEVQLNDKVLRPVVEEIFTRICRDSLKETMKLLQY